MQNLLKFRTTEILTTNQTQKTLYLLGKIQGSQGEAIAIITPKLQDPTTLDFKNVQTCFINDIYSRFTADLLSVVDVQLVFPITQKHKNKYRRKEIVIHYETGQQYASRSEEILKKQLPHCQWVNNIFQGKSQAERILYRCQDFLMVPDLKYTDFKEINKLHLNILFSNPKLCSLRDLSGEHLTLLEKVKLTIDDILRQKFGININHVRMYFHYPPTFYRLHIHIMHLNLQSLSCRVERCHDLNLVIQNIKMKGSYYQQVTLNTLVEKQQ